MYRLLTRLDDWRLHRLQADAARPEGGLALRLRRFALTTNNLTYALYGEAMRYWAFYPSGEPGWGQVPVWGVAEVRRSDVPSLGVGEALYGFFPMAQEFTLQAGTVAAHGFVESSPHRADLAAAYQQVLRCSADPAWREDEAPQQLLVRPLYATAYALAGFLQRADVFGARALLMTSASSKTALATAHAVQGLAGLRRVGLTSAAHVAHLQAMQAYDEVLSYDELARLDPAEPVVVLDFAGSNTLRVRLHAHYGDALRHDAIIGATQAQRYTRDDTLPGARPTFFFAPDELQRQVQAEGRAAFGAALAASQRAFLDRAFGGPQPWLRVDRREGWAAGLQALQELSAGRADPARGLVIDLPDPGCT